MHRNLAMLYFFALNKSKIIQFYYSSPIIEIGITHQIGCLVSKIYHNHSYLTDLLFFLFPIEGKYFAVSFWSQNRVLRYQFRECFSFNLKAYIHENVKETNVDEKC